MRRKINKTTRWLGILLHRQQVWVLDAQHGLLRNEALLATPDKRGRLWGNAALKRKDALQLFTHDDFPLRDYWQWLLAELHPPKQTRLLLLNDDASIPPALWRESLRTLGLERILLRAPLEILAKAYRSGLLVYLEDGLCRAAACDWGKILDHSRVGYGQYFARAVRQHVQQRYQLHIDLPTAHHVWQRLGLHGQQVTVSGQNSHNQIQNQMLISEDFRSIFESAFAPLLAEIRYLHELWPSMEIQVLGHDLHLPGLQKHLKQQLPVHTRFAQSDEALMLKAFQHILKEMPL